METTATDEPAVLLMWQESAGGLRLRRYAVADCAWKFQLRLLVAAGYLPRMKFTHPWPWRPPRMRYTTNKRGRPRTAPETMNAAQIAETAFAQLAQRPNGVNTLTAMVGANAFTFHERDNGDVDASFRFKLCRKANHCTITYDCSGDVYDLTFRKIGRGGVGVKVAHAAQGLYAEDLRREFESFTGLYTRL